MTSDDSIDVMVAALERQRRIGWARAYAAEEDLAHATRENAQLQEKAKVYEYLIGVIDEIAPSLSPWLAGPRPGLQAFDGTVVCATDDSDECRRAGARDAAAWLAMDIRSRQHRDWRAAEMLAWYRDPEANVPSCAACSCASWHHEGPGGRCFKCECFGFVPPHG
ncbi:hypothetical protein LV457_02795 [Mycobacterium sp. MYCO198283]|uniref:hypothetical protein n=1 Tax=Mycobacterium sp. MYCO198283 TaxID=2883505 RepID=UPI001E5C530A|nr:hypothetical protein [Mycobacterium sp. MYCO198283]MCG5431217.1 hypothetical protein [Mycobacterium sp. MYCO198283]